MSSLLLALLFVLPNHAFATDATWNEAPLSGDWNTAANWTPAVVPDGTASFGISNITDISISQNPTSVAAISFDSRETDYTITILPGSALLVSGAGVSNSVKHNQNFVCEGAPTSSSSGGLFQFSGNAVASGMALTVTGGTNGGAGGLIEFHDESTGDDDCYITLSGNATLDISMSSRADGVNIGSLIGKYQSPGGYGIVNLGSKQLSVGGSNKGNFFDGLIQDGPSGSGGSLHKIGKGNFHLTSANTYTGGTTIDGGALVILTYGDEDSATGSGPVQVNAGVLAAGNDGIITGPVTIGAGAYLEPGYSLYHDGKMLTIEKSLTLAAGSIYHCNYLDGWTDTVYANGITIEPTAQLELSARYPRRATVGTVYTILNNTSSAPINGTFENVPDGITFFERGNIMQVSYEGGDGNDLTLTVLKSRDRN